MPPVRLWFVLARVLVYSFASAMVPLLTQLSGTGTKIHLYAWLAALLTALASAVTEASLAWPKDTPP